METLADRLLREFLAAHSECASSALVRSDCYHFSDTQESANYCLALVLSRDKRATTSVLWAYEAEEEPLPEVGQLDVITDFAGTPRCLIETTGVEIRSYEDVDETFAFEEGEGDKSLAYWQSVHWEFCRKECATLAREATLDMPLVLQRFSLVHVFEEVA